MAILALAKNLTHHYQILDKFQAGLKLSGWEVKSLRLGGASLKDSVATVVSTGLNLTNLFIKPYAKSRVQEMNPTRPRRLLLTKSEIFKIGQILGQNKHYLLVPANLYTKGGLIKCELALVLKKKNYDKRKDIKEKEVKRRLKKVLRG